MRHYVGWWWFVISSLGGERPTNSTYSRLGLLRLLTVPLWLLQAVILSAEAYAICLFGHG